MFGPKPKDWSIKMNKKEKRLALSTAIASGVENAVVVEEFGEEFEARPKTKEFIEAMRRWGVDPKEKSMFLMMEVDENVEKSGRNIGTLKFLTPRSLNLFDVLSADKLVFTTSAVEYLNQIYGVDSVDEDDDEDEDEEEGGEVEDGVDGGGEEDSTPEAAE